MQLFETMKLVLRWAMNQASSLIFCRRRLRVAVGIFHFIYVYFCLQPPPPPGTSHEKLAWSLKRGRVQTGGKYKNIIGILKIETCCKCRLWTYVLFLLFWSPQRVLAMEVIEKSGRRGNRGCRIALRYFASSFQRLIFFRVVPIAFSSLLLLLDPFFVQRFSIEVRTKCPMLPDNS
jgi:hypothetical protein